MAGRNLTQKRLEEAEKRIDGLEKENADLRRLLAQHAPHALAGDLPEPITAYDSSICAKVVAMGAQGMGEDEWIAALGLDLVTWQEWKLSQPDLTTATKQAHAQMRAYWDRQAREAMANSNSRFPMQLFREFKSQTLDTGDNKGDASKLVLLDLRTDTEYPPIIHTPEYRDARTARSPNRKPRRVRQSKRLKPDQE